MPVAFLLLWLFGASIGSFLNVVILRSISGEPIGRQRSHCPHCRRTLQWYELVPIASYVVLRGACRTCGRRISVQYPLVELAAAWLAVGLYSSAVPPAVLFWTYVIAALLVVLFVIDLKTFILPDFYIVFLGAAAVFHLALVPPAFSNDPLWGALAGAGFLFSLWLITRGKGLGFGDVKLMIPLGLLFGLTGTVALLFMAFTAGGLWGSVLLLTGRASGKTPIAFGPFLCGAALALLLWPGLPHYTWTLLGV